MFETSYIKRDRPSMLNDYYYAMRITKKMLQKKMPATVLRLPHDLLGHEGLLIGKDGKNMRAIQRNLGVRVSIRGVYVHMMAYFHDHHKRCYEEPAEKRLKKAEEVVKMLFEKFANRPQVDPTNRFQSMRHAAVKTRCELCMTVPGVLDRKPELFSHPAGKFMLCQDCTEKMMFPQCDREVEDYFYYDEE